MIYKFSRFIALFTSFLRKFFFYLVSDHKLWIWGRGQPILFKNYPNFKYGNNCTFGVEQSPFFFTTYMYVDCREPCDVIQIGNNCHFNNNISLIAKGGNIKIGDNCLIGSSIRMISSDFHDIDPANRFKPQTINSKSINIGNNVFIGDDVTILKGVNIGDNSVIASGALVSRDIEDDCIVGGVPAVLIKKL